MVYIVRWWVTFWLPSLLLYGQETERLHKEPINGVAAKPMPGANNPRYFDVTIIGPQGVSL